MAISDMRMETSYNARMFAMADRLFVEFDHLPVGRVFTAVANARATVKKCHHSPVPDPGQVEQLARDQLRQAHTRRTHHDHGSGPQVRVVLNPTRQVHAPVEIQLSTWTRR